MRTHGSNVSLVVAISPEMCVGGLDLTEPRMRSDGRLIVYAVSDSGAAKLIARSLVPGRTDRELATEPALRPARGLGGGAWCFTADEASVVYVAVDGNLWQHALDGDEPRCLTDFTGEHSLSSPCCSPDGHSVAFVVDDAAVFLLQMADGTRRRVDDNTADFCLDPFIEADSASIRWLAWNVPDMPWDRSRVQRRTGDNPVANLLVAGAVQQPRVLPDGRSICVRDDDGWLNVWISGWPAVTEPWEHAGPTWGPGQRSYTWSPDCSRVAFTRNVRGFGRLCTVASDGGSSAIEVAHGVHGQLSWAGKRIAGLRSDALTPTAVVTYDTDTWQRDVIATGAAADWERVALTDPVPVEIEVPDGVVHARRYDGAGRGLIVWLHGGPTDQWQVSFLPRVAFWRAQGWTIVIPDYRGSTGHGRAYQQALAGEWGVLDVNDTLAVTRAAHTRGWGNARGTVVMGGSAGGFTALRSVAAEPGLFAAAVVLYPVTDLADLAHRSHRFERHYSDSLIGPLPAMSDVYRQRSPIEHAARFADPKVTPLLILHGDADPVVPMEQSTTFAERVRAAGGHVELQVYEGEGHGFRQRANQLDEYQRIADFFARHVPLASTK